MKKLFVVVALVLILGVVGCHTHGHSPARSQHSAAVWRRHLARHAAFCAYHSWRLYRDARHGHTVFAAYQGWRTVHHCRRLRHG